MEENNGTANIEKIKLGEKEYTQDELQEMVGIAEQTRKIEEELNTKIDKVYPAFTKTSQEKAELERRLKEMESKNNTPTEFNEEQIKDARNAAKKIGIVTKDDFASFMQEHFRSAYQQERSAERLLDECKTLEGTYNGEDGRPKFKTQEVLEWMRDNGGKSPEQAYKMKYEKEIDTWKEKTLGAARKRGMTTEEGSDAGNKEPPKVRVTRDNIEELMKEALGQG